jgi:hypothetical protein
MSPPRSPRGKHGTSDTILLTYIGALLSLAMVMFFYEDLGLEDKRLLVKHHVHKHLVRLGVRSAAAEEQRNGTVNGTVVEAVDVGANTAFMREATEGGAALDLHSSASAPTLQPPPPFQPLPPLPPQMPLPPPLAPLPPLPALPPLPPTPPLPPLMPPPMDVADWNAGRAWQILLSTSQVAT